MLDALDSFYVSPFPRKFSVIFSEIFSNFILFKKSNFSKFSFSSKPILSDIDFKMFSSELRSEEKEPQNAHTIGMSKMSHYLA